MNIRNGLLIAFMGVSCLCLAQDKYKVIVSLDVVVEDKVMVICEVPKVAQDSIIYTMPKMVPGTYSINDYGRFISNFAAYDADGDTLSFDRLNDNQFLIKNSQRLASINYWVDDTFDADQDNFVFEPGGTNIDVGKNFVINTFGFVGYLEGMKDLPYELQVNYPNGMYGASALEKQVLHDSSDVYLAPNYFDLADGPIMYAAPDTTTFEIGGAQILISIYSPNKVLDPNFVREQVEPTLKAQYAYLGELPVDRYAFIIYLFDSHPLSGRMGALEHSYSSFYSLPEIDPFRLAQVVRNVAAHEFFHILTPLNIHSEEIGNFDFTNPKMSKHLWMYEGVTEYAAGLAQVKYGEMNLKDYLAVILDKVQQSRKLYKDDLPFTEMSLNCLNDTANQYGNVYQKGALIGMALDIRLRELSEGEYGVQNLMQDLSKKYGKDKSFKDDELFDTITALTFPEIRTFFSTYVEGPTPIPYRDFLQKVGVDFSPKRVEKEVSLGHISFSVSEIDARLIIHSIDGMNVFGQEMGYQEGDILYQFDKVDIDIENYEDEFAAFATRHQAGDEITAVVMRINQKGKLKKVKLKANAIEVDRVIDESIQLMENPSEAQLALRKAWVNK